MRTKGVAGLLFVLFVTLAVAGCSSTAEPSQLANPASEYCVEQGGEVDIRQDAGGGEVGYCQFDDDASLPGGSECEEWAFFRGDCQKGDFPASTGLANPAAVYCSEQGAEYEIREHEDGGQYGVCIFEDGSECDAWDFFRGECAPGQE